jgi:hypothetical protein
MTADVSLELLDRMKRVVELTEKLHTMQSWNDEARRLSVLINHEIAIAQEVLRLRRAAVRKKPVTQDPSTDSPLKLVP